MRAVLLALLLPGCKYFALETEDPPLTAGDDDDDVGDDDDDDVPDDVECGEPYETPEPGAAGEGECVTGVLTCGETVQGTNAGGSLVFSNEYEQAFEWCSGLGEGNDLSGPERVYLLEVPEGVEVVSARLSSCQDSELLWYQTSQVCPEERLNCQYATVGSTRSQSEDILLGSSGVIWFVVEGLGNDGGNFALTVDCLE